MKEVTNMFQRMRELAVQAISDSNTNADRGALNNEYKQLSAEVARIAENTQWNGTNILDGARTNSVFQIGANADQTIAVNFGDLSTNNTKAAQTDTADLTLEFSGGGVRKGDVISWKVNDTFYASMAIDSDVAANGVINHTETDGKGTAVADSSVATVSAFDASTGNFTLTIGDAGSTVAKVSDVQVTRGTHAPVAATDITSSGFAATALGVLDTAIESVNSTRATLGASMSRLEYAADNLQNVSQNSSAARSRVLDADYASETTELARTQIIQQASTAMLSQANQAQQSVLSLLK
jgi:flagellin